jgi:hypothetical protein
MASSTSVTTSVTAKPPMIPLIYRILWFGYECPSTLVGMLSVLFAPDDYLDSFIPRSVHAGSGRDPARDLLMGHLAGLFFILFWVEVVVLGRRLRDIGLWRSVNAGLFGWDVIFFGVVARNLAVQGRLNPVDWRGQDYVPMVSVIVIGALRLAIALGIGMLKGEGKTKGE